MITNTNAPAMPHETTAGRARMRAQAKAGRLDTMPAWKLARTSGATWRETIDVVLTAIHALHGEGDLPLHWTLLGPGEGEAPGAEGPIPGGLSVAERAAIRGPLGRYAAARAAGHDDTNALDHVAGRWDETRWARVADWRRADHTTGEEGEVWVRAGDRSESAAVAHYACTTVLERAGTSKWPRTRVLGWWCLPSVAAVLGGDS